MGEITYPPPKGYPLGVTSWFKFGATLLIPLIKLISKREWRGAENIPKTGAAIVVSNHISYFDPLVFAHFCMQMDELQDFSENQSYLNCQSSELFCAGQDKYQLSARAKMQSSHFTMQLLFGSRTFAWCLSRRHTYARS